MIINITQYTFAIETEPHIAGASDQTPITDAAIAETLLRWQPQQPWILDADSRTWLSGSELRDAAQVMAGASTTDGLGWAVEQKLLRMKPSTDRTRPAAGLTVDDVSVLMDACGRYWDTYYSRRTARQHATRLLGSLLILSAKDLIVQQAYDVVAEDWQPDTNPCRARPYIYKPCLPYVAHLVVRDTQPSSDEPAQLGVTIGHATGYNAVTGSDKERYNLHQQMQRVVLGLSLPLFPAAHPEV